MHTEPLFVPELDAVLKIIAALESQGLIWESGLRCQECQTDDDVYETHKDLIDASRQVNICRTCLARIAMRG